TRRAGGARGHRLSSASHARRDRRRTGRQLRQRGRYPAWPKPGRRSRPPRNCWPPSTARAHARVSAVSRPQVAGRAAAASTGERLAGEPGEVLDLGRVLLVAGNGDTARIGSPGVEGAIVRAEVVEHARGEKIIVFRYKSKVRYRRKTGHRQSLTRLRITDILLNGQSAAAPPLEEAAAPTTRHRATAPATEPVE